MNNQETMDCVIENVRIPGGQGRYEVGLHDERIVDIRAWNHSLSLGNWDGRGQLLLPGFVDAHVHVDKAFSLEGSSGIGFREAIAEFTKRSAAMSRADYVERVCSNTRRLIRLALSRGTTTLSTHVNIEHAHGLAGIEAVAHERSRFRALAGLEITAMPNFFGDAAQRKRQFELLELAAEGGLIQGVGGAPHHFEDHAALTRRLFEVAERFGLRVDLHVAETDEPDVSNLEDVIGLTHEYALQGRVCCSHVTALSAVDDRTAESLIRQLKASDISVLTLPSCNLYLMGRGDAHPVRRGTTRIRELYEAGVNIGYASDNIRDPFRPIGNADMLEEGLLTAQVARMVTEDGLRGIWHMGTRNPARMLGLAPYGVTVGAQADLLLTPASSPVEAIRGQVRPTAVFKGGRVVFRREESSHVDEALEDCVG